MTRLTLSAATPTLARVLGMCATDSRIVTYANEAQQRLITKGKWVGTYQMIKLCVTNQNCLTWPRHVESIDAFAVCSTPGVIRTEWFEFQINGPGVQSETTHLSGNVLIPRGDGYVTFQDIQPKGKQIRVQADLPEAATARILLKGWDDNNNWIQTLDAGEWIEGEYVLISTTTQTTVNNFSSLSRVVKPVTNGVVRLFQWDATAAVTIPIAIYEPDETLPSYRRSLIPGLSDQPSCCSTDTCNSKSIHAMVKLRHIPVSKPNDFFAIGNPAALKLMVMAIIKEDRNLLEESAAYEAKAIRELDTELSTWNGDGEVPVIRTIDRSLWGGGSVENVVGWWG